MPKDRTVKKLIASLIADQEETRKRLRDKVKRVPIKKKK